jgi:hypothetical protein
MKCIINFIERVNTFTFELKTLEFRANGLTSPAADEEEVL